HYLAASYYERWLYSAEQRLLRKGTIAPGDVEAMMQRLSGGDTMPVHQDQAMAERILDSLRSELPIDGPPAEARFAAGDRVRVKRMHPPGHTRCPRYVRGAVGTVTAVHGGWPLPDRGADSDPETLYTVRFDLTDLWGDDTEPGSLHIDLWDSYLEPAT